MGQLSTALSVLSAMITPAVLILGCGSLILTTSNRLTRVIDRVREISAEVESIASDARGEEFIRDKRGMLFDLLDRAIRRVHLLQRCLTLLYLALGTFLTTSVIIGVVALAEVSYAAVALFFGFIGSGLMLWASIVLIFESRVAVGSIQREMDFVWKRGQVLRPPE